MVTKIEYLISVENQPVFEMKRIKQFILTFCILSTLASCMQFEKKTSTVKAVDLESMEAINPYFTNDQEGNPVLCWTSKDSSGVYQLKYAIYDASNETFHPPITVQTSGNLSTSSESMGKIAFKADGSVIAVYGRKIENAVSPYASAIFYSTSADWGQNWSAERLVHSDTSRNVGHSFFDLTRLKDGEVAAIWLDGRLGKTEKGLALFFAKTQGDDTFGTDTLLDKNTCECCRTDILTDELGNIHIAYRNINYPNGIIGKQVRDMAYLSSADNGKTFSQPRAISNDYWEIEGCPHTGPSLTAFDQQIHAVWFTAGGATGLYYSASPNRNDEFNKRTLISSSGRHPQMTAMSDGNLAITFEDIIKQKSNAEESNSFMHEAHEIMDHSKMKDNKTSLVKTQIVLHLINKEKNEMIYLTDGQHASHHAVITSLDNSLLIAWVQEKNGKASIKYTKY